MPVFDFSTSGQDTQGQLKHFSAQFCWHFGSALLRALSYKTDPGRLCMLSSLLWTLHLFPKQSRLPPIATKTVRSNSSAIVENLLRSTASKLPAPGNKSNTGEDGCSYMAFGSKVSSQRWPRCAPQCLLLLWGALEGLGRLSSLEGRPVHRPPGQTCFQDKAQVGTPWTQVQKSRPTSSVPPRCLTWYGSTTHLGTVVKRTRLLCYGCRATATALPCVFVTVLLRRTGSGSARSDGLSALTTNHPYGPSLVVGSYLVWDATRRELWETALLSTTRRLPVREYWTQ